MFDTVKFNCPSCKAGLEIQSKAGSCDLIEYSELVPTEIALDIKGETVTCTNCGATSHITTDAHRWSHVYLTEGVTHD